MCKAILCLIINILIIYSCVIKKLNKNNKISYILLVKQKLPVFNSSDDSVSVNNLKFLEADSFSSELIILQSSSDSDSILLMLWFLEGFVPSFSDFFEKAKKKFTIVTKTYVSISFFNKEINKP